VGQQEVHEYEALSGYPGGCLYCWLILFCQSLQTILRIILDITYPRNRASSYLTIYLPVIKTAGKVPAVFDMVSILSICHSAQLPDK
jgi:hypothetical protein